MEYMKKRDISGAQQLFEDIIERNSLNHIIPEKNRKFSLKEMSGTKMWLAPFMAKTEEIWTIITGDRLWNVYYQKEDNSASGISVNNLKDSEVIFEEIEDINDILIEDKDFSDQMPISLKYLIAELAFSSCISIKNGLANLNEFYLNIKEVNENIYLPLNYDEIIQLGYEKYLSNTQESILLLAKHRKEMKEEEYNLRKDKIKKEMQQSI